MQIAILCPVYNDWSSFNKLAQDLSQHCSGRDWDICLIAVDDGSDQPFDETTGDCMTEGIIKEFVLLRLGQNLGHQKAIALGLSWVKTNLTVDHVVVMDADGEDRAEHVPQLIQRQIETKADIVVAQRGQRMESLGFKLFYRIFRFFFRTATGIRIDFGNFSVLTPRALRRLVLMPELLAHYPATLIRSKSSLDKLKLDRGKRFFGSSNMNFLSLLLHAMGAISLFMDRVLVRATIALSVLFGLGLAVLFTVLLLKFYFDHATPGWSTTVLGVTFLFLFQSLMFVLVGLLFYQKAKQEILPAPASLVDQMVTKVVRFDRVERNQTIAV